jgi:hypothetical protein
MGLTPYLHGDHLNKNARGLMDELRTDCKNCEQYPIRRWIGLTLLQLKK